jgi:RHS repeat-associated protein
VTGDGTVLAEFDRRGWGQTQAADGARAETPLRFQGQHEDAETGLFYNRFRYYDPGTGLYISPDPIGLGGGLRPFGYAPNPTGWVDPLGLALNKKLRHKLDTINEELMKGGNQTCKGQVDRREARKLGEEFVGPGYTTSRTDKGQLMLQSNDGLRRYRDASEKSSSPYTKTGVQANFESRPGGAHTPFPYTAPNNVHLDVKD